MFASLLLACAEAEEVPVVDVATAEVALLGAPAADTAEHVAEAGVRPGEPGLTYEIYVRSFQDSDGDGIGDLDGLRSRLAYLDELGVRTLWLMPIFPAFGPAGYDVTSFDEVTPEYGTEEDLGELLAAAHLRGMRVLLDVPLNHVHRDHPWFVAAEAGNEADQARFRYAPQPEGDGWFPSATGEHYFAWFGADMPDLDWHHAPTRAWMLGSLKRWLELGVDGYRFDAVLMLDEGDQMQLGTAASHDLLGEIIAELEADHPDRLYLAEASEWDPEAAVSWLDRAGAPGCQAVLDFPRLQALTQVGVVAGTDDLLKLMEIEVASGGARGMGAFLGSHDLPRLPARVPDPAARRALRVLQYLLPGSPVLYYGEELDLADATTATGQDYPMRAPMPWSDDPQAGFTTGTPWFTPDPRFAEGMNVAEQATDPGSTLTLLLELADLRERLGLDGTDEWHLLEHAGPLLHFERVGEAGAVEVRMNLGSVPAGGLEAWGWTIQ